MKTYRLTFEQFIPTTLNDAWDYFSSPFNLAEITPSEMAFDVQSPLTKEDKMFPGLIISYKVSPLLGIRLNWVTEITHIQDKSYFVDEQRFGPFAFWHHLHQFQEVEGGILMQDVLHYAIGWGPVGILANEMIVHKKLNQIFSFRKQKVEELFKPA